jgi:hypothetical protein
MTRRFSSTWQVLATLAILLGGAPTAAAKTVGGPGRAVASLISPAHGTAFAFGHAGSLLTTAQAVAGLQSVSLVTASGQSETATVYPTSNRRVVQLRGSLALRPLHGGGVGGTRAAITVLSGPVAGSQIESGRLRSARTELTSVRSGLAFEGAPVLDSNGRVIGVATQAGGHLSVIPVKGLGATATAPVPASRRPSTGISALAVVAIVFAFGVGVGSARIAIRAGVVRRLGKTSQSRNPRAGTPGLPRPSPDPNVNVVLRRRPAYEPLPDVRLRSRSRPPDASEPQTGALHAEGRLEPRSESPRPQGQPGTPTDPSESL